jgi:hypothetical protein
MKKIAYLAVIATFFVGCKEITKNLTQDINLNLPTADKKLVVECYLQPGQPFALSLSETVDYFGAITLPTVKDATVTISHNGEIDTLKPLSFNNNGQLLSVYVAFKAVPADYTTTYRLDVLAKDGRKCWATTTVAPPVTFDSVQQFTYGTMKDNGATADFYRYMLFKRALDTTKNSAGQPVLPLQTAWKNKYVRQFRNDDRFINGQNLVIVTNLDKDTDMPNDTFVSYLYHITPQYNEFLKSAAAASNANGNPFAQPAELVSNINGGIGIFTGFNPTEHRTILK